MDPRDNEPRVAAALRESAINRTSEYLIQLIRNQDWCAAKQVGHALQALIDNRPSATIATQLRAPDTAKMVEVEKMEISQEDAERALGVLREERKR